MSRMYLFLVLDELVQGAQVVKKHFCFVRFLFFFSRFSNDVVLCAALITETGKLGWKRECWLSLAGSIVQQHPLSGWRSLYSGLKTLQSFLNKFQPRECFWCSKIDLCKVGNCLCIVFLGQKQSVWMSAGFGPCCKCVFPLCPHCFMLCWLLKIAYTW